MDAAEYKHVVLGLIFLKYISGAFEELYQQLDASKHETGADPEDPDETYKWKYGLPLAGNANYAWLQHFVSKLAPSARPVSYWPLAA